MVKELILSDFKRHNLLTINFKNLLSIFIIHPIPGLKFMIVFRLTQYYRRKNRLLFYFFFLWLRRLKVKYGLDISYRTQIGKGLYIGHFGGIVIHGDAVIGDYCNISQGVTIGVNNHVKKKGVPRLGNRVFVGPNACIFGNITIEDNVTIGANTVITDNVLKNSTVLTPKPTVIDKDLSSFFIHNLEN